MLNELLAARGAQPRGLYPVPLVAELLGLTPVTVRRLIRSGALQAIRRRRSIIGVTHAALEAFLAQPAEGGKP